MDDRSEKYTPLLPLGTGLFVVDGPTAASGYQWWQVVPVDFAGLSGPSYGWVAAASREGEPWIEAHDLECPSSPKDLSALAALSGGTALACFARHPITVRARLVPCNCDIDGPGTEPAWLGPGAQPILLVAPSETEAPPRPEDWFVLHLDPDAGIDPVPVGKIVDVTGFFDHPAAEGCLVGGFDEPPSPSLSCRFAFAVTNLEIIKP